MLDHSQVITRINYGQNVDISGLAGAVGLAGSESGLWSVQGGNWQMAAGLIKHSNATLNLHEEITSISYKGGQYELQSKRGNQYLCGVAVIATPLDELNISFSPPISIPSRSLQHTHATFVRGLLNPVSILSEPPMALRVGIRAGQPDSRPAMAEPSWRRPYLSHVNLFKFTGY